MSLTSAALTIAFHGGTNGRGRLKRSPARLTGGTSLFAGLPVRLGGPVAGGNNRHIANISTAQLRVNDWVSPLPDSHFRVDLLI